ncbi:VOC family protein [Flavobacterium sp.]|uniref:VOC family protein n=1 Tax=Flavobacterium sp. TaxID=239 RepID=UPI00122124B0|nr:VOC family protein [Flavobacterium sp.]RZJ70188.1 MAG: glyoxalase [Flavobacterium sp.]
MKIRMIWANLAVEDLKRTATFYKALGFRPNREMTSDKLVSFAVGNSDFILNFFKRSEVDTSVNAEIGKWSGQSEMLFSLSADTKDEVDHWKEIILEAGGDVVSEPQDYLEGYTFCFSDLDGHKYNVLYWPGM